MSDPESQLLTDGHAGAISLSRVRSGATAVSLLTVALAVSGAAVGGATGSILYVCALCVSALVVLVVAMQHPRQARAWRLVGAGVTLWAIAGFLLVLREDAGVLAVPAVTVSLGYAAGYVPLLFGFSELSDLQLRGRRFTHLIDGVLLFLALYAVLWLAVVEHVAADDSLSKLDRAFSALYPAGDLALVMMAARIISSRAARRRVGLLLLAGSLLATVADVAFLAVYLDDPYGLFPIADFLYLLGLGAIALAAVWSLLPAPPPVPAGGITARWLATIVAVSSFVPPAVLVAIVLFTDRDVSVGPVAVWVLLAIGAAVARHLASVKELEQAHQQALWLASHDHTTDLLHRSAFLHEVAEGGLRDRTGTVIVVEALDLQRLRDARGYDAVDVVIGTMAARLRIAAGDNALIARLAHDQLAVFMRSADLARGRQAAEALQRSLASGVQWGEVTLALPAVVGVAQADGAVIDALAGVRRAGNAVRMGRAHGAGFVAIDADLTGSAASVSLLEHPSRPVPVTPVFG